MLQALSLIKNKITAKDKRQLLNLQKTYGKEALMRSIVSVRAQGTTIHSLAYLGTMLQNEKSPTPAAPLWRNPYLGVQPVETRYTEAEMSDIISRKIAESRLDQASYAEVKA